jgi:EAL domain-containing protein (putative c-di-GMP-specific phosphodiesterase class I)
MGLLGGGKEPSAGPRAPRVLIADDDPAVARSLQRVLGAAGFEVVIVGDGNAAVEELKTRGFEVVLTDIHMPGTNGVDLLRLVRAYDLDVPVILMTGEPEVDTAVEAIELGALGYLRKPLDAERVVAKVQRAARLASVAKVKREALAEIGVPGQQADLAGLQAGFDRALSSLWMAFQPIVAVSQRRIIGYEALMRSHEGTLPDPAALLGAAERLGRVEELGRRVRERVAAAARGAPAEALLFVNVHPCELLDAELGSGNAPLSRFADHVVLEVTERRALDEVRDLERRVSVLRFMGYRVAVDDLGAANAGLASFARLEPEFVKLDISLVRGLHQSPARQRLVRAMTDLGAEMGTRVIAEGVESGDEVRQLVALGCDLMQGFFFAAPSESFADRTNLVSEAPR